MLTKANEQITFYQYIHCVYHKHYSESYLILFTASSARNLTQWPEHKKNYQNPEKNRNERTARSNE